MSAASSSKSRTRSNGRARESDFDLTFSDAPSNPISDAPKRTGRAQDYEEKISGLLSLAMRGLAGKPSTVPDAAAIIQHGPIIASKLGDLADQDANVRKAVDFITSGSENPYAALVFATLPLVAQIIRNHETEDLSRHVQVRIPFTKKTFRLPIKLRLKNPMLRNITQSPQMISAATFGDPEIAAALASQNINVAWNPQNGVKTK